MVSERFAAKCMVFKRFTRAQDLYDRLEFGVALIPEQVPESCPSKRFTGLWRLGTRLPNRLDLKFHQ